LLNSPLDLVGDRVHLTLVVSAADDEIVGNHELARNIEDRDPLRLLVGGRRCDGEDLCLCLPLAQLSNYRFRRKSFPTTIVKSTLSCSWGETNTAPTPSRPRTRSAIACPSGDES
jgi:hypothetical protein